MGKKRLEILFHRIFTGKNPARRKSEELVQNPDYIQDKSMPQATLLKAAFIFRRINKMICFMKIRVNYNTVNNFFNIFLLP